MNNTTKSKQNAESEMHDYDYKTKKMYDHANRRR